ncbi:MAG: PHP domain-containing protein [Firmicutes bacterium]|nr:PHP domain-containing protein [Bacillota bacterium]
MLNRLYRNGQLIDLHIHTQYSDGTYTVPELLRFAEVRGLEVIAFCDHDLLMAQYELRNNKDRFGYTGKIIDGCEIGVTFNGKKYELLAYDFDLDTLAKFDILHQEYQYGLEEKRLEKLKALAAGLGFKFTKGLAFSPKYKSAQKTFFHDLAKYPENQKIYLHYGIARTDNLYRDHVAKPGALFHCYNIISDTPTIEDVCARVHKAGGITSFAHPFEVYGEKDPAKLVEDLTKLKILDGFECIHKKFSLEHCLWMQEFCDKNKLLKTGGSDFHGDGFRIKGVRFAPEYLGYVQNADLEVEFPIKASNKR